MTDEISVLDKDGLNARSLAKAASERNLRRDDGSPLQRLVRLHSVDEGLVNKAKLAEAKASARADQKTKERLNYLLAKY